MSGRNLIQHCEESVKIALAKCDASHNFQHVDRVRNLAKQIAKGEGIVDRDVLEIIEVAALLHDVADYKYSGSDAANEHAARSILSAFSVPEETQDKVLDIVNNISFSKELDQQPSTASHSSHLLGIVQDADRLDAIGAIGIARCFYFGASKNRPIYDDQPPRLNMTKEEYRAHQSSSINHFHEKLLLLKHKMKTPTGKAFAERRHQFMVSYLDQLQAELQGET
jgi:uncharacterized protein